MARIKINLPKNLPFQTEIPIRITDLNYGGHVGNDTFLSIIHEARLQFFQSYGFSEMDVDGVGTIMSDALIQYKTQVYYGSCILVKINVTELSKKRCELTYLLVDKVNQKEVARAKTGLVFFDYTERQIAHMPDKFRNFFE